MNKPKVAVVVGSESDLAKINSTEKILREFGILYELKVASAHRMPKKVSAFAKNAKNNFDLIIAAAGKAAALPGVIAAYTPLPVIGVPIESPGLGGVDALFSIVQMPKGIPVATVAIDGFANAAILAAQILSLKYPYLRKKVENHKRKLRRK